MCPKPEAIGIGGSIGRRDSDSLSDIDIFVIFPQVKFFRVLMDFPEQIKHPIPVIGHTDLVCVKDFGFIYTFILEDGTEIDYALNSEDTLGVHSMRANTRIVYDSTGYLTRIVEQSKAHSVDHKRDYQSNALPESIMRLLKIKRALYRDEHAAYYYNMDKLRLIMVGIERAVFSGNAYNSFHSDRRLQIECGSVYERSVLETFPIPIEDKRNLFVFDMICNRINEGLALIDANLHAKEAALALKEQLIHDIRNKLTLLF